MDNHGQSTIVDELVAYIFYIETILPLFILLLKRFMFLPLAAVEVASTI